MNFLVKNRPDQSVLSNIGIKMLQQLRDGFAAADSLVKARFVNVAPNMPQAAPKKKANTQPAFGITNVMMECAGLCVFAARLFIHK